MSDDEESIFQQEMAGVKPLERERRVPLHSGVRADDDPSLAARRLAAVELPGEDRNILAQEGVAPLDAWFVLDYKRPGVQNGVFRKLKQGRYEADAHLDLHRMTVAIARRELFDFVEEAQALGLRTVLLIHGKGESKAEREKSSILKGCVNHWLPQLPPVQAFHSAQPRHGGTGAVYVLLQKSEEMKRKNRLHFSKGREPLDTPNNT
ncbi:MAG: DNA endonuclease SmrA [Halioglobus sp.]